MTNVVENDMTGRSLSTPRAAAIAGILFGLLFSASLVLLRSTIPANPFSGSDWIEQGARRILFALELMPFAGIAFLWFIGVLRDLLGAFEDKLFSTVFFGSGILFLAMVFVSMAIAGGLIAGSQLNPQIKFDNQVVYFSRSLMFQLVNVYAIRMAGVFMLSLGTIWLRTRLIPRWLTILTYLLALSLLLIISLNLWVALIFPAWVVVVSIEILRLNLKRTAPKDHVPGAASPPGSTDLTN
jgi:hypothetical protein